MFSVRAFLLVITVTLFAMLVSGCTHPRRDHREEVLEAACHEAWRRAYSRQTGR
ncbi:uncharacterized protein EV420DRAFT_1764147 [Desarmillaria tabescens]|uniref:Lipoprotein n=1 Tax=Armillaria tabescens TaxID=1929756 RepID=A0AA39KC80_ARMTA|nr:uncharacterized protein EV420DRAFT_1764147 [Desarmillaria tabescens]KAK0458489.1 hypothetical protein EV420DRAFT_1764147 [Desarmillaria tabescens]